MRAMKRVYLENTFHDTRTFIVCEVWSDGTAYPRMHQWRDAVRRLCPHGSSQECQCARMITAKDHQGNHITIEKDWLW